MNPNTNVIEILVSLVLPHLEPDLPGEVHSLQLLQYMPHVLLVGEVRHAHWCHMQDGISGRGMLIH